ncbi:hypothetical protein AALP_AA8G506800 [Arabis alpina]|uniref:RPW8 domain-containing protein n=1 Tax=Arabis alpina TaxID=50452 RepID=A0A087GES0_ARAAL|nr:hypothetical protein AALP_AA8G506800 [Arabis alpina]
MAELMAGAALGALVSEGLKRLIAAIETVVAFEPVYKELASTVKVLEPIIEEIVSLQKANDLKSLTDTIAEAEALVKKCRGVHKMNIIKQYRYTKKVWKIQREMVSFCQGQLPLLQHRNQLKSMEDIEKKLDNMMKYIVDNLEIVTKQLEIVTEKLNLLMETVDNNQQTLAGKFDSASQERNDNHQTVIGKLNRLIPAPVYRDLCSVPKLRKAPVGLDWPLKNLKKKLLGDDSVDRLLVFGASGFGKTTLVTRLCHDPNIKEKFKHIFFNVVSRTPNFRKLVQDLLEHNKNTPPTFENDNQAIDDLQKLLKTITKDGPILIVLDDVWRGGESLLEIFKPTNLPGCRILVTSQFNFPSFGFNYELKTMDHEDARVLLIQWASRPLYASQAEYEDLLKKILKGCNYIPIVIEVRGIFLKGKSLNTWREQVEKWHEEETILDNPHATAPEYLQSSFSALESNLKECFLDMGSFPEDQKISASVIIDIWVELYGKGTCSSSMYMNYLKDLDSQNLLKLIPLGRKEPEEGFYNEFLVTQHDALRELAILQSKIEAILERKRLNLEIKGDHFPVSFRSQLEAIQEINRQDLEIRGDNSPDWCQVKLEAFRQSELEAILKRKRLNLEITGGNFPHWCLHLKKHVNARLLFISTDALFSSNWVEMEFPNVEALVLNISSSTYELPSFIETMANLKVVIIINHGFYPARLNNFPCLSSLPNLKRIRLEKVSITFLDMLQLQCINLNKISLVMCRFGEISHDTKEIVDVSKALPSLEEIDIDYCYDLVELPFWISEVVSLKTLSITNCNKISILPEAIGNLSKLETLRLISCTNLSELPETTAELNNLRFLDISGCFQLEKLPLEIGNLKKNLKKISMRNCYRCNLPNSVKNLEDLKVICDEGTTFLWERFKTKMKNLTITEEETEHNLNSLQQ